MFWRAEYGMPTLALVIALPILMGLTTEKQADAAPSRPALEDSSAPTTQDIFGLALAEAYGELAADMKTGNPDNFGDAHYFAVKAVAAYEGEIPQPEHLNDWSFTAEELDVLHQARSDLVDVLGTATQYAPRIAARAQAHFDCWIERAEENWASATAQSCRNAFDDALMKADAQVPTSDYVTRTATTFETTWTTK